MKLLLLFVSAVFNLSSSSSYDFIDRDRVLMSSRDSCS